MSSISADNIPHYTRFQRRLQTNGKITMGSDVSIAEVNNLAIQINQGIPGIKHASRYNTSSRHVDILYRNELFEIYGPAVSLYKFLISPNVMNCLHSIKYRRLSDGKFNQLFTINKINKNLIGTSCPICLDEFHQNSKVVETSCNHIFHEQCLRSWLTEQCIKPTCPCCRNSIV